MDRPLLAYSVWLGFTDAQKKHLVRLFSIPRTGESVVHVGEMMGGNIGARAKQDGYRPEDLYAITTERIYQLLNQDLPAKKEDQNFYGAFNTLLENLEDIYVENFGDEASVAPANPIVDTLKAAGVDVTPSPEVEPEKEFVPRDPEELIKPKTTKNAKARKGGKA